MPSRWFCNGSVNTDGSVLHTNGSVMVLYIQNNVLYTEPDGSFGDISLGIYPWVGHRASLVYWRHLAELFSA